MKEPICDTIQMDLQVTGMMGNKGKIVAISEDVIEIDMVGSCFPVCGIIDFKILMSNH